MGVDRNDVRGILAQLEASGLSQREFGEREGIPSSTLAYWIRRERVEREARGETALVAVSTPTSGGDSVFAVEFDGVRIEVPRNATVEEWRRLREAWAS